MGAFMYENEMAPVPAKVWEGEMHSPFSIIWEPVAEPQMATDDNDDNDDDDDIGAPLEPKWLRTQLEQAISVLHLIQNGYGRQRRRRRR